MPEHAPAATRGSIGTVVPRASDSAEARRPTATAARRVDARSGRRPAFGWRPLLATLAIVPMVLSTVAPGLVAAAQRDTEPGQAAPVLAAEEEPTPEPTPTPKPTPKPTPWPTPPGLKGIDVSHWNGYPNFSKLRDQGMRFVFAKATQGTSFVDDTYGRNARDARAAGVLVGAYHFFDYRKGGVVQANHYLDTLRLTSGLGGLLPLVVDVETLNSLGTPDKTMAKQRLHAMLDELYRRTGRYPMIYTSKYMWQKVVGAPTSFGSYPLWVACWKCETMHLPDGWNDWLFWQVGQFKFQGGAKLDGNVHAANIDKLRLRRQRAMRLDDDAEWAGTRSVKADLRGYDGTDVRYALGDAGFGPWLPYAGRFDLKLGAKQGKQDVRLQLRSFRGVKSPVIRDSIRLDTKPPNIYGPRVSLRGGVRIQKSGARVPTVVDMGANDDTSGLASASLRAICDGATRASTGKIASNADLTVQIDRSGCSLVGEARDVVKHRTTQRLSPDIALIDARYSSKKLQFTGGWKMITAPESVGRTLARGAAKDAAVRLSFEGAQFAVVARRGPSGGKFKVIVDGKHVATVDLYAKTGDPRRIVYVGDVPKGSHEVRLKATGTHAPKSRGTNVWLDAILVLDRRK